MIFAPKSGNNEPAQPVIIQSDNFVTLIGGGKVESGTLEQALRFAPLLVAADGGANQGLALGHIPVAVIGDMDSLSAEAQAALDPNILHAIDEQESTDFDKALRNIDAPGVLAVGFTGRRIDHELSVYHSLVVQRDRPCIVLGRDDLAFHLNGRMTLSLPLGTRVSLFPMAKVDVTATGLLWPVEDMEMAPWLRIGTSNQSVAPEVTLVSSGGGLLVILPREHLAAAIEAIG